MFINLEKPVSGLNVAHLMRDLADVQDKIIALDLPLEMKSLRGKPQSIMFLGFNSLVSQQAAGNLTQERLKDELDKSVRPKYQRIWEAANKGPHR
jgi:hypothetical protein